MNPANHSFTSIMLDVLKVGLSFFLCLVLFFFMLFSYTKLAGPLPFSVTSTTNQKSDAFNVTGTGKASAKADSATVRLGVTTSNAQTAEAARDQINQSINKVSSAIKALGVAESDIKTENFNINPNYDYSPSGNQKITGYMGNTNMVVKVKNTDLANKVIDTATANGANQIGGVTFDTLDQTAAETEARQKAIEDAKKKAQVAATAAGFKLGKLLNYNEGMGGGIQPMMYDRVALSATPEKAPTMLEEGQNEITVTVTLSYEIL